MGIYDIVRFPNTVLKKKAKLVKKVTDEEKKLIKDMFETMYRTGGVGLAAPQIGISKRIAVINPTGKKEDELVLINPEILKKSGKDGVEEGCLSLPGPTKFVKRAQKIKVRFLTIGNETKENVFEGVLAIIIQHETDHLDGKLFVDRLNFFTRRKLLNKFQTNIKNKNK